MHNTRPINRRTVLETAAAALGAWAVPQVIPAAVLGKDAAVPASERIGLAYIGPGNRGRALIQSFAARPEVANLAVCDVSAEVRKRALDTVSQTLATAASPAAAADCKAYIDFREVLARSDVDGVVVSASEHWRPIMCIMAAKAGKDVYTEKPLALTIGEAGATAEAMRRHGRIFQHGTQRRSTNERKGGLHGIREACELARNGRIGRLTHATAWVGPGPVSPLAYNLLDGAPRGTAPPREVFDLDLWFGPVPPRGHYGQGSHMTRGFGLGSIGMWGSHTLDMAQWALDKDETSPVEVIPPDGSGTPLTLRYADGLTIYVPRTPRDCVDVAVFGTEGQKTVFGWPPVVDNFDPTPLGPRDVRLYHAADNDHYGNWLHCMRTRSKTICNEEVALRSNLLCHLVDMADRLRRPLKFDPVNLEFPGDEEANRLLDTPKRAPWQVY